MKKNLIISIFCGISLFFNNCSYALSYIPFDDGMNVSRYKTIRMPQELRRSVTDGSTLYLFFKQLYEKNNLPSVDIKTNNHIPHIIHHIWLGSPLPEVFTKYIDTWKVYHPEWEYILWDDRSVAQLELYNQELYDAATNYGQKSDIVRYEILYRFGGLYVDIDFECVQPFDVFHERYDLYAGILPLDTGLLQIGNGLIGACPGHPLLLQIIESMHMYQNEKSISAQTGPIFFTHMLYKYITHTQTQSVDVAFPPAYLYPLGATEVGMSNNLLMRPHAVHHWAHSWCDQKSRRAWFISL